MTLRLRGTLTMCLFLLVFATAASARGLDVYDVARLQLVGSAVTSPNGQFVAYTVVVPRDLDTEDNGSSWTELHLYDTTTRTSRPFVTGEVNVSSVKWSPDGSHIAYLAKRDGDEKTALYAIPVAGGESRRLVKHAESIGEYDFSSDGTKVAFIAREPEPESLKQRKEKGLDAEVYEENVRRNQLFVVEIELDDWRAKAVEAGDPVPVDAHVADLHFRPGHDEVLVSVAPSALIDVRYMDRQYARVDLATGEIRGRIETEGKLGTAAWSPDGERVAFIGPVDIHDPAAGRLFVAPASGGAPTEILPDFMGHVRDIEWVDAKTVMYLADVGCLTQVGTVRSDGKKHEVWLDGGEDVLYSISLGARGKQFAATGETPMHPRELYVAATGRDLVRATDVNPWLADVELGKQEVFTWEARDGLTIEGVLTYPLDYVEGQKYPLIVYVHGGPEANERNGWQTRYSKPGQVAAAEGYFVMTPNYRGSTGRGHEFSILSQGDPGGKEFEDIVDGVDALIATGMVDGDRVGITGGSYGGYATAWGATYFSERYAAAVMFVGISEQYSKFGTTDIPRESQLVHQHPRKVYDDWQFFLERSPVYHAKGARTPLLILHGKDDPRVHPSQSLSMYRYYKMTAEAPVRLVWYPGEGHGNSKAGGRLDYSLRLMRWMNHFLKDGGTEMPEFELDYQIEGLGGENAPAEEVSATH